MMAVVGGSGAVRIELKLSDAEDGYQVKNLWPLYQHDVSRFERGIAVNRHGLLGADEGVRTLAEHGEELATWWREPGVLFPYLIVVDGMPVGFNFVAARPRIPVGVDADFVVHEFFLLHAYRGGIVAEEAAAQGFDRHRGKWEVVTWPTHLRAIAFWRRVLGRHAHGGFEEGEIDHPWGRRFAFRFDNSAV